MDETTLENRLQLQEEGSCSEQAQPSSGAEAHGSDVDVFSESKESSSWSDILNSSPAGTSLLETSSLESEAIDDAQLNLETIIEASSSFALLDAEHPRGSQESDGGAAVGEKGSEDIGGLTSLEHASPLSGRRTPTSKNFRMPSGNMSGVLPQPMDASAESEAIARILSELDEISDEYVIGNRIGRGASAMVYEAWRKTDNMHVVIKVLHSTMLQTADDAMIAIKRFLREAKLIQSIKEPHVVQCVDYGCFNGMPCIVLEFVEGVSLDQLLERLPEPLSIKNATDIIEQVLSALAVTHEMGIIHRDIKPSNIMVFDTPPPYQIRVLDFGIATVLDNLQGQTLLTQQGNVRGTPSYMAPELFSGDVRASAESDLYAVGLVYLECLTGKTAVAAESFMRVAYKQVNEPLEIPGFIPPCLVKIIERLCCKSVEKRYHTAQDVLNDIHAILDEAIRDEGKYAALWAKSKFAKKSSQTTSSHPGNLTTHDTVISKGRRVAVLIALVLVFCIMVFVVAYRLAIHFSSQPSAVQEAWRNTEHDSQDESVDAHNRDEVRIDHAEESRDSAREELLQEDPVKALVPEGMMESDAACTDDSVGSACLVDFSALGLAEENDDSSSAELENGEGASDGQADTETSEVAGKGEEEATPPVPREPLVPTETEKPTVVKTKPNKSSAVKTAQTKPSSKKGSKKKPRNDRKPSDSEKVVLPF